MINELARLSLHRSSGFVLVLSLPLMVRALTFPD
jgi:hypothetical protein